LALVEVHEKVEVLPKTKEVGVAVRLTVGNGLEPLPPHEAKKNKHIVRNETRFIYIKLKHKYIIVNKKVFITRIYVMKYDTNSLAKSHGFTVVSADLTGFIVD
tara:strand:- start:75 stop:383 length:309 start_codon:yes stop_codon:yes gene_type:complete